MGIDPTGWWPLIVVAIVAGLGIAWHLETRRRTAFEQLAASRGWQFDPGDSWWTVHWETMPRELPTSLADTFMPGFSDQGLFARGYQKVTSNVVTGEDGNVGFRLFDYRYTAFGKSSFGGEKGFSNRKSRVRTHTVAILRSESLSLPAFQLRPESLGHKLASATVGFQDFDFPEFPKFSAAYLLRGPDEEAVRAAFDSRVLNWFSRNPDLSVEGEGKEIVVYRPVGRVPTARLEAFQRHAIEIAALFQRARARD